ncbi:MAG: cytochrome ubiquinol oxidase subunit I [Solirubrobacterales bacterium]|nr:cytochrome ubiquinol oxidase subunit I [Solirubrobacterales bacterium]MBV9915320.1 cytochrome ubiquinol oxidase subunit I [Solirubrobacterales bacterium]
MAAAVTSLMATALPPVHQTYLLEARQMQALSFAVHIPLVCFGIAFPAMVLFVEWLYHRSGDELYLTLARRWTKVMAALFAVGVITGTILSFEMGLLWPNFTATFGSVFGLGFAIEGFSFFMEAIFIGIYIYGWDRLSRRAHLLSGIPIVLSGFTGSLMVIAVNAWMNHPGGFALSNGKVVHVRPLSALFGNSFLWHELVHMYVAGYIVMGFVVAGAYAVGRLRGRWGRYERTALTIPLTIAALAAPVQLLVGDWAGREVARLQPTKLAALEGVGPTEKGAALHILGWYTDGKVKFGIPIPHGLSVLAYHSWNATVQGLYAVPASDRPPVNVVRFAFQTMVGIGTLLALLGIVFLVVRVRRRRLPESRWFYGALALAGPASVVALICGWVTTEVGRQPWVVYHVMRTSQAVTGAGGLPVGYATLALAYVAVAIGVVWILRRLAAAPLETREPMGTQPQPAGT